MEIKKNRKDRRVSNASLPMLLREFDDEPGALAFALGLDPDPAAVGLDDVLDDVEADFRISSDHELCDDGLVAWYACGDHHR
jgi:hypothetical protein